MIITYVNSSDNSNPDIDHPEKSAGNGHEAAPRPAGSSSWLWASRGRPRWRAKPLLMLLLFWLLPLLLPPPLLLLLPPLLLHQDMLNRTHTFNLHCHWLLPLSLLMPLPLLQPIPMPLTLLLLLSRLQWVLVPLQLACRLGPPRRRPRPRSRAPARAAASAGPAPASSGGGPLPLLLASPPPGCLPASGDTVPAARVVWRVTATDGVPVPRTLLGRSLGVVVAAARRRV
ncbi:hypothetical protein MNEG_1637 [Monoraphidium neglectum]|jgi:hypothetical protein|uniref:Uncharacterized protein n=1 Tax=Monoraphidium neglectum TaxID=145388 RepID=A0A0D2LIP1_9CHLO|nr:hypothetical protein MNEG_1637 [Monoraphidium neglectum]KIZ06324.1 hypothetical protein MNEG_1637 [Monoraphidium neglectum]|eukprot:XP_013905343.1 hypothetical protein MNEG_1637 [Monoraphidium neglectum]